MSATTRVSCCAHDHHDKGAEPSKPGHSKGGALQQRELVGVLPDQRVRLNGKTEIKSGPSIRTSSTLNPRNLQLPLPRANTYRPKHRRL